MAILPVFAGFLLLRVTTYKNVFFLCVVFSELQAVVGYAANGAGLQWSRSVLSTALLTMAGLLAVQRHF